MLRTIFALLTFFSIGAFADKVPSMLLVGAAPCGQTQPQQIFPGTPVQWKGQSYLITRALNQTAKNLSQICFSLTSPATPARIQLLSVDHRMGLMLLSLQAEVAFFSLPSAAASGRNPLTYDGHQVEIVEARSERHLFSTQTWVQEVANLDLLGDEFLVSTGAPMQEGKSLRGIFSDQSIVMSPGQATRLWRERDLALLASSSLRYERLVFAPATIVEWMETALGEPNPRDLQLLEPTRPHASFNRTGWQVGHERVVESCFQVGAASDQDLAPIGGLSPVLPIPLPLINKPIEIPKDLQDRFKLETLDQLRERLQGGVEPVGVGGLEELLSNCRLDVQKEQGLERLLLAFRRDSQGLRIQSLLNVHGLLLLQEQQKWNFLVDEDFHQGASAGSLRDLRQNAIQARDLTVSFFRQQGGNPLLLRKAFLLSSLLNSRFWQQVKADEIKSLIQELDKGLPLSLGNPDPRIPVDQSPFAKAKKDLLQQFELLTQSVERLP